MGIDFIGNTGSGQAHYQVKTVLWTLFHIETYMESLEHFAEIRFVTWWSAIRVGIGRVYATPMEEAANVSTQEEKPLTSRATLSDTGPITVSLAKDPSNTQLGLTINFLRNPRRFHAAEYFQTIMDGLIFTAEYDALEELRGISNYNHADDFTLSITATSEASVPKLKNYIVISALKGAANLMAQQPVGMRYKEFQGTVRWDGPIVGRIYLLGGRNNDGMLANGSQVD